MRQWVWAAVVAIAAISATSTRAVTPNQVDNFENNTTQGWTTGGSGFPSNISTGGPAGANDNYMQMNSNGSGSAGGRLIVFNRNQWAGDYTGIVSIAMDLRNGTGSPRPMRIALKQDIFSSFAPAYVSTNAFDLPADNAWHNVVFNLDSASLTGINGAGPLSTFLADVPELRILATSFLSHNGDALTGPVGVDNITALVPEPSALGLLVGAGALLFRRRR